MTDNERRRIFGLARELGINRDELHILVNGVTGCTSITELNKKQTYAVIKELNDRIKLSGKTARKSSKPKKEETIVPGMITPNQKRYCWNMMYHLAELEPRETAVVRECAVPSARYLALRQSPKTRSSGYRLSRGVT